MIQFLALLVDLAPEIQVLIEAIEKGVSREEIRSTIRSLIVKASDAEMKREFPNE